ncbi:hypothetical protein CONPUDRAFT_166584 [Coniophora puteana RWD-64-598 SS2]|uniref:F-box domain-containing protein n=1 Tax=Coniophora puteana (strain RWD-64-598) TaxID=741705 RepID=A0A5M3MLE0_CONPW|nr:uncharacterized protein CONPUDRAFT_166584 [Coniophora puteana RWD-64-598 SS2]EIW79913.1 hypothetical protein CONPUDRAFT_166584 [Coniophora puteana RWD-64-598 SS2]
MHPCLQVAELTAHIISFISPSTAALTHLAQTCKAFEEPALNALYYEVHSFGNFLMCLPQDLWEKSGRMLNFRRAMLLDDWKVLQKHARRVRVLHSGGTIVNADAFSGVFFFASSGLFPNLKVVHIPDANYASLFSSLPLICGPRVVDVRVSNIPPNLVHGLTSLGCHCTSLSSLFFSMEYQFREEVNEKMYGDLVTVLSDAVAVFVRLENLHILLPTFRILPRLLSPITRLPSLKSLVLDLDKVQDESFPIQDTSLPRLESVEIINGLPDQVSDIVSGLTDLSQVQRFHANVSDATDVTKELLDVLAGRLAKDAVRSIRLDQSESDAEKDGNPDQMVLEFDTLPPLFRFSQLTELVLDLITGPTVDDNGLDELSLAFPKLRRLRLGMLLGMCPVNSVTLKGFALLLRNCPVLDQLSLVVDVTPDSNAWFDEAPIAAWNTHLTVLQVMDSPIDDAVYAVRHLLRMLPYLRQVISGCPCVTGVFEGNPFGSDEDEEDVHADGERRQYSKFVEDDEESVDEAYSQALRLGRWAEVNRLLEEHAAKTNPYSASS